MSVGVAIRKAVVQIVSIRFYSCALLNALPQMESAAYKGFFSIVFVVIWIGHKLLERLRRRHG